jgi:hypothetical protein
MYQSMFGSGVEDRKQSLIKRLTSNRPGGGAARVANPYLFQSTPRKGIVGLPQAAALAPYVAFSDAPGFPNLGAARQVQSNLAPSGNNIQPLAGIGPAAPNPGSLGSPQSGSGPGTQWLLGRYNNNLIQPPPPGTLPGWLRQGADLDIYNSALQNWLYNNPGFGGE